MSTIDALVAAAGLLVMVLMIVGMFLLTPRGTVAVHAEGSDGQGSNLSPATKDPQPAVAQ